MTEYTGTWDDSLELIDNLRRFLRRYYKEEVHELAENYPDEQDYLELEWQDLYSLNPDVAGDYLDSPEQMNEKFKTALREFDLPIDVELRDIDIRVTGLNDEDIYSPVELAKADPDGYIGVTGELKKATAPSKQLKYAAFECQRCGTKTKVAQSGDGLREPHQCQGCERQGPFLIEEDVSEFTHYCKVRIETPPDKTGDLSEEHIDGHVEDSLVWHGHEDYGLVARTGDSVTVYGQVDLSQNGGENDRLFTEELDIQAIDFETEDDALDIPKYRDEFERRAAQLDAVDKFAQSLAPELYATPEWERALELLVAYLFGAPRIDVEGGPTYRGDIHALIISDYGMGKSTVNRAVARYSPQVIKESVTGMSSDVGLLAAAVEDDFGDGQWTIKPGILVRGNGGHVILDEIDKTDADLERMNDALEGEQLVDIDKAGQSATYQSRIGLLATGNPSENRFDKHTPVSEQLDIGESLLSRFDGIVTMKDEADEEIDYNVAGAQGEGYIEAHEYEHGDREEFDHLESEIGVELGKNWIAYARQNCFPSLSKEQFEQIQEWYAEDVRQLNEKFAENKQEGHDMPVPVTSRKVEDTIRFATAFARVHLRDEVAQQDLDRAMDLVKTLVGQTFDGTFEPPQVRAGKDDKPQKEKISAVNDALPEGEYHSTEKIAAEAGVSVKEAERYCDKLANRPEPAAMEKRGKYRGV